MTASGGVLALTVDPRPAIVTLLLLLRIRDSQFAPQKLHSVHLYCAIDPIVRFEVDMREALECTRRLVCVHADEVNIAILRNRYVRESKHNQISRGFE